ncbi:MAG: single-stranded DNA-binding protein [Ruminococcus sp.]|nr:single-stranded DNA-binding protein [Ruminococcus sp.]
MINSVVLMGRLTADPELRTTTTGKDVCSFCVAIQRRGTERDTQPKTDFINIVAWESTARFVCRYFKKGQMIAIQGAIQTRSYEDKNKVKRIAFEVIAREVSFCGNKGDSTPKPPDNLPNDGFSNAAPSDFEEIVDDEDLPF